ncbi:MAG TPA: hypothetical protein VFA05_08535 [Gaiellaceae bacterium]|nr:hypothetical protein [Gaiellaceae bacterium]
MSEMGGFGRRYSAFDHFQQRHRSIGFPLAALQKYVDDQGGYLAATITYYGFFAIRQTNRPSTTTTSSTTPHPTPNAAAGSPAGDTTSPMTDSLHNSDAARV